MSASSSHDTTQPYGGNTPLRGTKLTGFEGGIRTPLVVRWPAVIQEGGRTTGDVGHVMDFMATFLDLARVKYPTEFQRRKPLALEGKSLLPVFQGQDRKGHVSLCWSLPRHHAIRAGKWKAVKPKNSTTWQLFDLENDGTETSDLANREPERVREMATQFEAWRQRVGAK